MFGIQRDRSRACIDVNATVAALPIVNAKPGVLDKLIGSELFGLAVVPSNVKLLIDMFPPRIMPISFVGSAEESEKKTLVPDVGIAGESVLAPSVDQLLRVPFEAFQVFGEPSSPPTQ